MISGPAYAAEANTVTRFEVVRDPLWDNIRLDPEALRRRRHPWASGCGMCASWGTAFSSIRRHTQPFRARARRVPSRAPRAVAARDAGDVCGFEAADRSA